MPINQFGFARERRIPTPIIRNPKAGIIHSHMSKDPEMFHTTVNTGVLFLFGMINIMRILIFIVDYFYAAWLKLNSYFYRNEKLVTNANLPTVILVPGVYENWYYFRRMKQLLLLRGYNVINADSIYQSESLEKDSDALSSYVNGNSLYDVTLIGHSSGGITALKSLSKNSSINKIIAIAAPFSGVSNVIS